MLGLARYVTHGGSGPSLNYNFVDGGAFPSAITFSRGSNATQFDSSGNLVYAPANLFTFSEDFGNAAWVKARASISSDATTSPANTANADKLVEDTAVNNSHAVYVARTGSNETTTLSIFAKAAERTFLRMEMSNFATASCGAFYNLTTGAVTIDAPNADYTSPTASMVAVGNGWYRCVLTVTKGSANTTNNPFIALAVSSSSYTYTGDGTSGLFLWGAQLNLSPMLGGITGSLSTYYPTTASAYYGPRLDYDPATLLARGFLVEEQRTNSIRNSTMQGAVAGTPGTAPTNWGISVAGAATYAVVGTGTENGITYIDIQIQGTGAADTWNILFETTTQIVAANGQSWSGSFYLKLAAGSTANLPLVQRLAFRNNVGGAVQAVDSAILTPTSAALNTQRTTLSATATQATTAFVTNAVNSGTPTGAFNITLRIGLPQLEQGAFATSVIPTTTTALTRNADVATVTPLGTWFDATAGTIYAEFSIPAATASRSQATFGDGTANERMIISNNTSLTGTSWRIVDGGVDQADISNNTSFANNATVKVAGAYAVNDFATCQGGGAVGTDTSGTLPTVTTLYLGSNGVAQYASSYLRRITYYPRRLPDATLQQITA